MKERPILMHARSINGILAGRKIQTRRIVSKQPPAGYDRHSWFSSPIYGWTNEPAPSLKWFKVKCPYGFPGDRLWVRETFYCDIGPDGALEERKSELYYRADVPSGKFQDAGYWGEPGSFWKPSIFMPRWASRLTLEITGIRVERVQKISEGDAKAEGCQSADPITGREVIFEHSMGSYRLHFQMLWDSTNGKGAWDRNDWVWVVDFKRIAQ